MITITVSHSSAGITTNAAGGTGTAPGGLLGGDIDLYVDNSNGDLTAAELARIQDAVTAVDGVTEPFGVAVQEVADPTLADVTLNMDTTSAVGGYPDGVLGCTTDAGQITIIVGWNFYAGSDATQISSAQYDFETVVVHELGHALGLGHSANSASVMVATLNTGTASRVLTVADLNVADSDSTGACGLHVVPASAKEMDNYFTPVPSFGSTTGGFDNTQDPTIQSNLQAGPKMVLTDWQSASHFSIKPTHLLNDTRDDNSRLSPSTIDEQNEFWSSVVDIEMLGGPGWRKLL
jgi:hypothetical protein